MNKNEIQSFSSITLNSVKIVSAPVEVKTKTGGIVKYCRIEYNSVACRGVPRIFSLMLRGKAGNMPVNEGDYINITAAKLFTSAREEDKDVESLGVEDPAQITVIVHDGGFVNADEVMGA